MRRIAYIDGLRAIAVLAVVVFHTGAHNAVLLKQPDSLAGMILRQGCHGVDLFFVLSGFCLSYPVLLRLSERNGFEFNVVGYAARRLVRIVPPFYIAMALILLGTILLGHGSGVSVSAGDVLMQGLFLDKGVRLVNPSFWTLAIEFRWYFLFPIVLWLWVRSPRAFVCIMALTVIVSAFTQVRNLDLWVLPAFMLGIPAADMSIRATPQRRYAPALLLVLVPLAFLSTAHGIWVNTTNVVWAVTMFAFVVSADCVMFLRGILSSRPLVAVGLASYGVYLVHEPVLALLESRFVTTAAFPLVGIAIAAVLVGMLFSAIAERPFVASRLRNSLVINGERVLCRLFACCGVSGRLSLTAHETAHATLTDVLAPQSLGRREEATVV